MPSFHKDYYHNIKNNFHVCKGMSKELMNFMVNLCYLIIFFFGSMGV
jgi:hypothetical protein